MKKQFFGVVVCFLTVLFVCSQSYAIRKHIVLKGAAITKFLKERGEKINTEIDRFSKEKGVDTDTPTKVVPIISVGDGKSIGAVQLTGKEDLVKKAGCAMMIETDLDRGRFNIKILIPAEKEKVADFARITGLGFSAMVDIDLEGDGFSQPSYEWEKGAVLKAAAVGKIIEERADEMNKHINKVLEGRKQSIDAPTKVVPFISVGEGAYIGAMQIAGEKEALDKVEVVLQLEKVLENGKVRIGLLVPSSSIRPTKIERIKGVGATAIIDVEDEERNILKGGEERREIKRDR